MDYELRPVTNKTSGILDQVWANRGYGKTPEQAGLFVMTFNKKEYERKGGKWVRRVRKPEPIPEFRLFIVFGGQFPTKGGIFGVMRIPGRCNWHKKIVPALRRLLKKAGYDNDPREWYTEGYEDDWLKQNQFDHYDYDGQNFVKADTTGVA